MFAMSALVLSAHAMEWFIVFSTCVTLLLTRINQSHLEVSLNIQFSTFSEHAVRRIKKYIYTKLEKGKLEREGT